MDLDRQLLKMLESDIDEVNIQANAVLRKYNIIKAKVEFNYNNDSISAPLNLLKQN